MQTGTFKASRQYFARLRLGVTVTALLILAGSIILIWLVDHREAGLLITLAAVLVGWVVTLILAEPHDDGRSHETRHDGPGHRHRRDTAALVSSPPSPDCSLTKWAIVISVDPCVGRLHNHPPKSSILTMTAHPVGAYTRGRSWRNEASL